MAPRLSAPPRPAMALLDVAFLNELMDAIVAGAPVAGRGVNGEATPSGIVLSAAVSSAGNADQAGGGEVFIRREELPTFRGGWVTLAPYRKAYEVLHRACPVAGEGISIDYTGSGAVISYEARGLGGDGRPSYPELFVSEHELVGDLQEFCDLIVRHRTVWGDDVSGEEGV